MFYRHDSGPSSVHGPHSKDFCQEPFLLSEDTFQGAKGEYHRGQRREEESVKLFLFFIFNLPLRKYLAKTQGQQIFKDLNKNVKTT